MSGRLRLGLLVACAAAGCLPAGEPPQGELLLKGRDNIFLQFQPVGPGEPSRLLVGRYSTDPRAAFVGPSWALYDMTATDPATGQAQERLLLDPVLGGYDAGYAYDARGRLLLPQVGTDFSAGLSVGIVRVDPKTGERTELGQVAQSWQSTDRTLLLLTSTTPIPLTPPETTPPTPTMLGRVRDLDDHETPLPPAIALAMADNDVYFVSKDQKLFRLRGTALADAPELVADQVASFVAVDTARGPILLLARPAADGEFATTHALFEPATSQVLPLPGETAPIEYVQPRPSPDGRFVLFTMFDTRSGQKVSVLDRETGTSRVKETSDIANAQWRPEHDEVWLRTQNGLVRWRVGGELEPLPEVTPAEGVHPNFSIFTPDGRFVLSGGPPPGLRSADDPAAQQQDLGSQGTAVAAYWPLPDGRGIAEVFTTYQFHADLVLVDPVARTSKTLASGGRIVAVGAHRALAFLEWIKSTSSGTLALIDLDTGARTVLGENVYAVTLEAPPTELDRLPPGARVAFLVRNRIASPYDGVWMTSLP